MNDLASAKIGQQSKITSVDGNDTLALRLMEMGLTPGVAVSVVGSAPLGDPIEVEIRGYRLSLRKTEAARVKIENQ